MSSEPYIINNVKIHLRLGENNKLSSISLADKRMASAKQYSNFMVIRLHHFVYSIFPRNGHINICGIRNFKQIKRAVRTFNQHFDTDAHCDNITVDNSTASGQLDQRTISLPS